MAESLCICADTFIALIFAQAILVRVFVLDLLNRHSAFTVKNDNSNSDKKN